MSVGLNTRTSESETALARFSRSCAAAFGEVGAQEVRLGGRPNSAMNMAGGRRHVQRETLKTSGSSHWRVFNPRLPWLTRGLGLEQPPPVRRTCFRPSFPHHHFMPDCR